MAKKAKPLDLNKVIEVLDHSIPHTAEDIAQRMELDFTRGSKDRGRLADALDELLTSGLVQQYGSKFIRPHDPSRDVDLSDENTLVGVIIKNPKGHFFKPSQDEHKPIKIDNANYADGTIVTVRASKDFNSVSRIIADHGNLNEAQALSKLSALEMGIPLEFPTDVIEETIGMTVPLASATRRDMTNIPFLTIDPLTAKDFDDAICVRKKGKNWQIMVAIADVSHYVRPGTKLFDEAYRRGNSSYLPGLTIPMLPETLSNGLCSLKPNELRAAMVTTIEVDSKGNLINHEMEKAVIRSRGRLNYDEVQEAIDGFATGKVRELYNKYILKAEKVTEVLQQEAEARGFLDLSVSAQRIDYSANTGFQMDEERNTLSHQIIASLMIANNRRAVAELERLDKPILSRAHGEPNAKAYDSYKGELEKLGVVADETLALGDRVRDMAKQSFELRHGEKVRHILIRIQDRAGYAVGNHEHYGLGLKDGYTHFTSPIRRFTDLIVHSMVKGRDNLKPEFFTPDNLREVATHLNKTERRSEEAEKRSKKRMMAQWMEQNMGKVFNARVVGLDPEKGEVEVRGLRQAIHTYVPVSDVKKFKDGEIINIVPVQADKITGIMRFKMAVNDNDDPSVRPNADMKFTGKNTQMKGQSGEGDTQYAKQHKFPRKRRERAAFKIG